MSSGTDALNSVSHYGEVKVDNSNGSGNALLGVGTAKAAVEFRETRPRINLVTHSESWVLDCTSGYLHQDGQGRMFTEFTKIDPRNPSSNGSIVIGMLLDKQQGTLSYYIYGVPLGVAYSGLDLVNDELFPVMSASNGVET